ncbi:MAG: ATP-binding cassette domain-containing protein, partial [Phototrophicaceae bacterium]
MSALLQASDLAVGYRVARAPSVIVAEHLNLVLHRGELVCLLGPNGAGKSTLLRTMVGMQPPLGGRVTLDGQDIT